ncbi:MAG: alanine--tRNA ligase [DPANN group archaeon]|nr:alanine--tRNA ligase [DPANN group archaeon]
MLTKKDLKNEFSKDWKKHYQIELFKERGFVRKTCSKCSKVFWTLDTERKYCADTPCQDYDFIGDTITKQKWDYIETWKLFEKFFKKNGHTSIPRYPVVDRWRPDLYFTIASIQDFQRLDNGKMSFEYPANPLVVPQVCLRFPDIPNVGVTGRHLTSFVMAGQHAFGYPETGYFKDRCIDLNFNFLTKAMGIPEKELVYIEDIWAMPDFSAFGPCIETFSRGLELVNSVFMQFQKNNNGAGYEQLDTKVVDVGWGLERLVWFSNGTSASYDSLFGPVTNKMKKSTGIKVNEEKFAKYSKIAGSLNLDEVQDINKAMANAAKHVGVTVKEMKDDFEPLQNLYAVADHARTLLFATTDGGIPSNVGGGYNLRVLLRRSLDFINRNAWDFELMDIAQGHAKYLKPMFPELEDNIENMKKIVESEKSKYTKTLTNAKRIINTMIDKKNKFDKNTLMTLYESQGITPELIENVARTKHLEIKIPGEFYSKLSEKHQKAPLRTKKVTVDVKGIDKTDMLYYESPEKMEFSGKIIDIIDNKWLVLDKTLFYPTGGGQPYDSGTLNDKKVINVEKVQDVVLHEVEDIKSFSLNAQVVGVINAVRRKTLAQMHSATHILGASAKLVLGDHVWQGGANKGIKKSRLDITHYKKISAEELKQIEDTANKIIYEAIPIKTQFMSRQDAEEKHGFRIYQGGAPPGKIIRIVEVGKYDAEACGGIHCTNTKDIGKIKILGTKKIQDGIVRIEFVAGNSVEDNITDTSNMLEEYVKEIGVKDKMETLDATKHLFNYWKSVNKVKNILGYASHIETTDKDKAVQLRATIKIQIDKAKREYESTENQKTDLSDDEMISTICTLIKVQKDVLINTIKRFKKEIKDTENLLLKC